MRAIKIKMRNIVIVFFSLFLTLAVFSQTNAANPKPKPGFGGGDWLYFKSNNDLTAYLGKKSSSLPTVRYQKDNDYLEFSMTKALKTDISSTTDVSLETNVKTPNTPTLFYRNILDGADVNYQITNIPFKIKEEIILKKFPISNFQFPINDQISNDSISKQKPATHNLQPATFLFSAETSAKPVKQKDGSIAFFGENGEYLFQLDKPFMMDAKRNRSEAVSIEIVPVEKTKLSQRNNAPNFQLPITNFQSSLNDSIFKLIGKLEIAKFNGNWPLKIENSKPLNYQITLTASSDWLSTATYPVIIDPTVTHNADANFTGQMNRIADSDTTTSTQLEASYPEAVKDPYTVLLLHFNEANGTTAGIRDYASTTRVITANGNASTTSYVTQLGLGNSAAFDGTGDYLSVPDSEDWNFGTGNFTIDFWINFKSFAGNNPIIAQGVDNNNHGYVTYSNTSGFLRFRRVVGTVATIDYTPSWSPSINTWYHIALIRNSDNFNFFVNGVPLSPTTDADAAGNFSSNLEIGGFVFGNDYTNGYLDSLRIIKGRALTPEEIKAAASRRPYAVYTSPVIDATASVPWDTVNWTEGGVNTGNGEQPYNTNSLVAQWDFNDTSGATLTASSSGSCTTACNGTLTNFAYTASQDQATTTTGWTANNKRWGAGALMIDGTNDYVSVGDNDGWNFGTGNFTIEVWMNFSVLQNAHFFNQYADGSNYWKIYFNNDTKQLNFGALTSGSGVIDVNAPWSPNTNTWYHVALVRSGSTESANDWNLFVNGKALTLTKASGLWAGSWGDYAGSINIGRWGGGGYLFNGILDSARIYKGRALSASEILSNYNAGNIEIQTRTGATSDPNDGSWEAWKPTTGETQLLSMDSDAGNWKTTSDKFTKLLIHADEASGSTSLTNSSPQNHTITASGNASTTNTQSKFGGLSVVFDGTGDYLTIPDSDDWAFGTGDFSIDYWVRFNSVTNYGFFGQTKDPYDGQSYWATELVNSKLTIKFFNAGVAKGNYIMTNAWSPSAGVWYHIAFVRNGTSGLIFINGISQTITETNAFGTNDVGNLAGTVYIGSELGGTGGFVNGHLDEFRISKGIARWTSNFTPPAFAHPNQEGAISRNNETVLKQEGTASTKFTLGAPQIDGNTVALWHFEETGTTTGTYLYDETANNNDATTTGTTVVDGIFGKARKFNGTSDYVSVPDSVNWSFGTGDFSIDFWVKTSFGGAVTQVLAAHGNEIAWSNIGWQINNLSSGVGQCKYSNNGGIGFELDGTKGIRDGVWHHVVCAREGNSFKLYIDGKQDVSTTQSITILDSASIVTVGTQDDFAKKLNGNLDEVRILKGRALSPDEIAETYRMGANHHLTRQVSAVDLSGANKLAFNVASDRPGTYLETMLGESDYANYELASSTLALSTTTVLYIKGDEIASSTSIKDSSFSGKAITANGNARTSGGGKIGNAVYFDGTGDYLSIGDTSTFKFLHGAEDTANFKWSIDFWYKANNFTGTQNFFNTTGGDGGSGYTGAYVYVNSGRSMIIAIMKGSAPSVNNTLIGSYPNDTTNFHHVAITYDQSLSSANAKTYVDGVLVGSGDKSGATPSTGNSSVALEVGGHVGGSAMVNGYLDEFRIIKDQILTPDQIRQAYEYGLRTHPITIDFGATLQTSDLISSATDYNFSLTATTSGLSATTSGLYLGDKIIIKENLGGTEYTAQGTVNAINTATGAITVPSWDTGSTFPASNGYSPNATVFKWQREYFDLTGAATTTRNAITNLTLRPTNGAEGRTIYLDDFRYNTNYLTASSSSAITSGNNRYLQYRAIFSSADTFVSPFLTAFNTLYTALANSFPALIGVSGGGFLSF